LLDGEGEEDLGIAAGGGAAAAPWWTARPLPLSLSAECRYLLACDADFPSSVNFAGDAVRSAWTVPVYFWK